MDSKHLSWSSARNICIVTTLAEIGHYPTRKTDKEAWFLSPLRSETQASFSVSLTKNLWFDFGLGKGGNIIDLVKAINKCSAYKAVRSLQEKDYFSFSPDPSLCNVNIRDKIEIIQVKKISHPALIAYLKERAIPLSIAETYCSEIKFSFRNKRYFSIGLNNHFGGWELRNKYYKGSCSPKSYSCFKKGSCRLLVTEGMFDFLSLATLEKKLVESSDCIILNSLSFLGKLSTELAGYEQIHIYFDNDRAGDAATTTLIKQYKGIIDKRGSYRNYKDLNEKVRSSY